MIENVILAILVAVALFIILILILQLQLNYKINREEELNEFEKAKEDLLRRAYVMDEENQKAIIETIMYCARNRIGTAIVIEGNNKLIGMEESGDSFGIGLLTKDLLYTMVDSDIMNKGAILIRKDYIVAYNCLMPVVENKKLIEAGVGRRGLGAYGTVLTDSQAVVVLVSGETGKISFYGHIQKSLSIDLALTLKEFNLRNGMTYDELKYRLNNLLKNKGIIESLESEEVRRVVEQSKETKEERRERKRAEAKRKREEREAKAKKRREEQEAKRLSRKKSRNKDYNVGDKDA